MSVVLRPVVLPTPGQECARPSAERVRSQRLAARAAVHASAERAGARLGPLRQDADGVPLAEDGWCWSLSHDRGLVAGVVARIAVGIDLERARTRRVELVDRVLDRTERALLGPLDGLAFARAWTAKEAVLKRVGLGLGGLSRCRLAEIPSPDRLVLDLEGELQYVEQRRVGTRVVSVHAAGEDWSVEWSVAAQEHV